MLNQFEDMLINTFIQKLNAHGVQLDAETVKKAIANSPQVIQQVEQIMVSNSQDKMQQIVTVLKQAAGESTTTTKTTTTGK